MAAERDSHALLGLGKDVALLPSPHVMITSLASPALFAIASSRIAKVLARLELPRTLARLELPRTLARLAEDRRGAVTSEYVILVGTVGLLIVGAMVSVGPMLLASYYRSRAILMGPYPLYRLRPTESAPASHDRQYGASP